MTIRTVEIPAAQRVNGSAREIALRILLVDANGNPLVGMVTGDDDIVAGEVNLVAGAADQTVDLVTQDSIAPASYYMVQMSAPGIVGRVTTQVPAGAGVLSWEEFIGAGVPVDPADIWSSRLWPPGGVTGQFGRKTAVGGIEWIDPPAGTGDVSGPASATDGNIAVFDGATGKLLRDGGPPGAGGSTDLSNTPTATQVTVESSSGTDTVIQAATTGQAGVMTGAQVDTLEATDAAGTARPPTAHDSTHDTHNDGRYDAAGVHSMVSVPASQSASGTQGQWAVDGIYIYVCVATNTWWRLLGARSWS